jgi:hypothetical protein
MPYNIGTAVTPYLIFPLLRNSPPFTKGRCSPSPTPDIFTGGRKGNLIASARRLRATAHISGKPVEGIPSAIYSLKNTHMKFVFILIDKRDVSNIGLGFYDRKEMMLHEAENLNANLKSVIWVLQPNY